MDDAARTTAMTALEKLWSEGCPLADPGSRATVLDWAVEFDERYP